MPRGVQRARVDGNHAEVISALRKAGIGAVSLAALGNGIPDVAAGLRGINVFLEVKCGDFPSQKKLTADELAFHESWPGQICVVDSPEAAVLAVIEEAKKRGVL